MIEPVPVSNRGLSLSCPHAAAEQTTLFEARDYISGDQFKIVRCGNCEVTFTRPAPAPGAWSRYYPLAYYGATGTKRFPGLVEWLQRELYAVRIRRLEKFNGSHPGRVLDVGCGRGFLLQEFHRRGWQVLGTEADDKAATHARETLKLPIKVAALLDALEPPGDGFDAIVLWHVLEHLAEPGGNPGPGSPPSCVPVEFLLVGVPNFGSCEARLCRDKWFHLDVPRHLAHFTPGKSGEFVAEIRASPVRPGLVQRPSMTFSALCSRCSIVSACVITIYTICSAAGAQK